MTVEKLPIAVPGFRAAGLHCGVKPHGPDLALIACDTPAVVAGVFTRSSVVGAPVRWCRRALQGGRGRAVVVNSGNSNVATGARGHRDTATMAATAARALDCEPQSVFVASTGVIGRPLPMISLKRGIPLAATALRPDARGWQEAAEAIRTTDTFAKCASTEVRVAGKTVHITGIAKGSGMIEPNMATMLAFMATDAAVSAAWLQRVLRRVCDDTFNRVTVDGETSTSDTLLLLAGGSAGHPRLSTARSPGAARFEQGLADVAECLARDLARDGEGATKLVTVEVTGARTAAEAERGARRIANSMLVKTALFGGDPNWGRILQTLGAGEVALRLERAIVELAGVPVFRHGSPTGPAALRRAEKRLAMPEISIRAHLGAGRARARIWTCDLSYDYVRINAEYTT